MKIFKSKKIKKKHKIKIFILLFIFVISYLFSLNYSLKNKFKNNILDESTDLINNNVINTIKESIPIDIKKPITLLNSDVKSAVKLESKTAINSDKEISKTQDSYQPIIYIYNTHQTEEYTDFSVYDLSFELSNYLNSDGIDTYFEKQSIKTFLDSNNLKYYKSYTVSKKYMKEAIEQYPTLKYFIDIHRDSVSKDKVTMEYNNKSYAKILFIVGLDNPNYNGNLQNTNKLNDIILSKVPKLSRGIMQKQGKGVNGVYNQDISSDVFLIEIGSNYSTKNEVENTIKIILESLEEYIRGVI